MGLSFHLHQQLQCKSINQICKSRITYTSKICMQLLVPIKKIGKQLRNANILHIHKLKFA